MKALPSKTRQSAWWFSLTAAFAIAALPGCGGGKSGEHVSTESGVVAPQRAPQSTDFGSEPVVVTDADSYCTTLAGTQISVAEIGLPTRGAIVTSATLKQSDALNLLPEYCEVKGSVLAASLVDPPINFQVNLPTTWNRKALQFGGGGFNGMVVTGLDNSVHAPADAPKPLMRGYMTFGSDSGHQSTHLTAEFGLNTQALANYAGESVKRTHDTAVAISKRYYRLNPSRMYHAGGSKGGHEGLVAAQRYGADYDGVIAYYPANQIPAIVLAWFPVWEAAYRRPGGHLNAAKRQLLHDRVMGVCDSMDGLKDGIVSNLKDCGTAFSVQTLRCPEGVDVGDTCLSDTQIDTLNKAASPMQFAFPLANGVTTIGGQPIFNGGDDSALFDETGLYLSVLSFLTGQPLPALPSSPAAGPGLTTLWGLFSDQIIRYWIQQNPASTTYGFDYRAWQPRVQQIAELFHATEKLDTFKAKGGKLLLVQGTTDMVVGHKLTSAYFDSLAARFGGNVKNFARYYVQPGLGHGAVGNFVMTWDSLSALEEWVERGRAPVAPAAAVAEDRSRPLCEYPLWPKYQGTGDPKLAASFTCVKN